MVWAILPVVWVILHSLAKKRGGTQYNTDKLQHPYVETWHVKNCEYIVVIIINGHTSVSVKVYLGAQQDDPPSYLSGDESALVTAYFSTKQNDAPPCL